MTCDEWWWWGGGEYASCESFTGFGVFSVLVVLLVLTVVLVVQPLKIGATFALLCSNLCRYNVKPCERH